MAICTQRIECLRYDTASHVEGYDKYHKIAVGVNELRLYDIVYEDWLNALVCVGVHVL